MTSPTAVASASVMATKKQAGLVGAALASLLMLVDVTAGQSSTEQQLQCYACGMPRVHPENDILGSYGDKKYNHSCADMFEEMRRLGRSAPPNGFLRSCPVGVKSCFGAFGYYDYLDDDPNNDLRVQFLGCSEAKYAHSYGCDREKQNVEVGDKRGKKTEVPIDMNLCFCSEGLCNDPSGELMGNGATRAQQQLASCSSSSALIASVAVIASIWLRP